MSKPLVSIIVPCYKQAHLLPETLNSVLAQTYKNWECIVVNDGSPDNTSEVVNTYICKDSRIKLLEQVNQGVSVARNNGINYSNGEFILPLDGDDLIEPTYIEKAIQYFISFPDTKLVYCEADRFDQKKEYWKLPTYTYEDEIWENRLFCSSIYKRSDYNKTIGYNPNMKEGYEDWDFWLSLLNSDDLVYRIPEVLFHYRFQKKSRDSQSHEKMEVLYKQIYNNHKDIYLQYMDNIILFKKKSDKYDRLFKKKFFNSFYKIYLFLRN